MGASSRFATARFYDNTGAPLTGLTVAVTKLSRTGGAVGGVSAVIELGQGAYGVTVTPDIEALGVILLFDGGASAYPRYQVRTVSADGLGCILLTDGAGALYAGTSLATFTHYDKPDGTPVAPPVITQLGAIYYLQRFVVPPADLITGISALIQAPASAYPSYFDQQFGDPYNVEPPAATVYAQDFFDAEGNAIASVRDLAINMQTGQFYRTSRGGLAMTSGRDAIRQAVLLMLGLLLGEWFLDTAIGFPMLERVLIKSPNIPAIKDLFRTRIEAVAGVVTCTRLDLDYNRSTRKLSVTFVANTDLGEISGSIRR